MSEIARAEAAGEAGSVEPKGLWTPGFLGVLVAQAGVGYALSSFFLLPRYLGAELGAGPAEIGRVVAAERFATFLTMPVAGVLVDRFGRRDFLTAGALLMALASLGFLVVDQVGPAMYGLRLLQGVGFGMAFAAGAALAVDEAPPERLGQAIGLFGLTMLSMNALAPALVELVSEFAGWDWAFATAAWGATIGALLSRRVGTKRAEAEDTGPPPTLREVMDPTFVRICAVVALVGVGFSAMFVYHQTFAAELGMKRVGGFFLGYTVAAVGVRVGLGRHVDRVGRRRVALVSLVLYAAVIFAMARLDLFGLIALGAGLGVAHGLWYPALNALAVEPAAPNARGKVMAVFQSAFNIGWALGPIALGVVAEREGYGVVFGVAGSSVVAALLLLLVTRPPGGEPVPGAGAR